MRTLGKRVYVKTYRGFKSLSLRQLAIENLKNPLTNFMKNTKTQYIWSFLRIVMGWTMLWPFMDKLFGLGFSNTAAKSWLTGNSPTLGFLKSTTGPFAGIYQSMAGNPVVDWLFMLGLLLIGLSLLLGIGMKIASYSGALMMLLMWTSHLPPQQNPIIDDHVIYLLVFLGLNFSNAGQYLGLGKQWNQTTLVKKFPFLE